MRLLLNLARLAFWIWIWRPIPRDEWLELELRIGRFARALQRVTPTIQEATRAFEAFAAAWDALPDVTKEEVRRLDASP
ncbi:hypothetical protein LCGC14_2025890 [marine sediment metagenome]|uniref:Uncharacterized protein n=1 Tax=marine sediment metagenome TaxID=412755 RepID=A0A0F9FIQ5_9ZZZZ